MASNLLILTCVVALVLDAIYIYIFRLRRRQEATLTNLSEVPDGHIGSDGLADYQALSMAGINASDAETAEASTTTN